MRNDPPAPFGPGIEAVVFDLGNVLIEVDFRRCLAVWSRHSGLPEGELAARFRIDADYERFERGEIGAPGYFESLRRRLAVDLTDRQLAEGWGAVLCGERPGARKAVAAALELGPVYLLTNTNAAHEAVWSAAHRDLLSAFAGRFVSSRMGCRKPEAAIYLRVLDAVGRPGDRVLFIDDSAENVQGALDAGIRAFQVAPRGDLLEALARPAAASPAR